MLLLGTWLVYRYGDAAQTSDAANRVLASMFGDIGRVDVITRVHAPLWVEAIIGVLGAAVVLLSTYLLFGPSEGNRTLDVVNEAKVRTMLREYGDLDSLGYVATRRDKAVVWDTHAVDTARAGVSYGVAGWRPLTLTDPASRGPRPRSAGSR